MKDLAKVIEACDKLDELKEEFMSTLCAAMKSRGLESMDTKEVGEAVDIIKDFAEAKKDCLEAIYYQKVTEAMLSYDEPRYGYNMNRYENGRYAPKGMGRHGYDGNMGMTMDPIYMMDEDYINRYYGNDNSRNNDGMGYRGERGSSNMTSSGRGRVGSDDMNRGYHGQNEDYDPRYGRSYNEYRSKRRYYHESHSPSDKREMDMKAEEHVHDVMTSMRDIWKDAEPDLKKKMKEDLTKLLGEMTV